MSVPRNWWNMDNIALEKRWSSLTLFLKDVYTILSKGLVFQDNFRGAILDVTFTAANADTNILHGLSYTPTRYLVLSRSGNFVVYDGSLPATQKSFYLRSSGTGTASIFIF